MKKVLSIILILSLMLATSSCGVTQKFTVKGEPGTEIYDPLMVQLGTINNSGEARIVLHKSDYNRIYVAYLLAHKPGTDAYIPFALDYGNTKIARKDLIYTTLGFLGVAGIGAGLMSTSDVAGAVIAGLGGGFGFSTAVCALFYNALAEPSEKFRYLNDQTTIQHFNFTKPVFTSSEKVLSTATPTSTTTAPRRTNNGKFQFDFGKNVEGVYLGSGKLYDKSGSLVDEYDDVTIEIVRVDEGNVTVDVLDEYGESFFDRPSTYSVEKVRKGYSLVHKRLRKATISLSKDGTAVYVHPSVNIDGGQYTLKITAKAE